MSENNLESNVNGLIKNNLSALTAIADSRNGFFYLKDAADTKEYKDMKELAKPEYGILLWSDPNRPYYSFIMTRLGKEKLKEIISKRI